ncbi:MAG: dihydroorotate dehydrogenase [Deltaproteobacteria bacterium]|nr:dihydroorotate dehydrogenase [Candidatus Anaeroferrophillacea bacterium]
MTDLTTNLAPGLVLKNPVITASGTFGYGREYEPYLDLAALGALVTKGLSRRPRHGNPPPRIVETACGMLNAIGLANIGIDAFLERELPHLRAAGATVIVNLFGETLEDYVVLARQAGDAAGVAAVELNISCPNVKAGGVHFGTDPKLTAELVGRVRTVCPLPLIVKLTPNVTDVTTIARAAADSGADCLSLINTLTGMAVDIRRRRPLLANVTGGLSGPAIKPVALRLVHEVVRTVDIPVIGMGGITSAADALEFLLVGARAVQVGTYNFVDPAAAVGIAAGIAAFLRTEGIDSVADYVGTLRPERAGNNR